MTHKELRYENYRLRKRNKIVEDMIQYYEIENQELKHKNKDLIKIIRDIDDQIEASLIKLKRIETDDLPF